MKNENDSIEYRIVKDKISEYASPDNIVYIKENSELDKIKGVSYSDLTSSTPSITKYVLSPWLPEQGIAFIYAATGVGKTLFTMNVAYSIANGGSFLKYSAPLPRKVLYIDGEMAFNQVHSRFINIVKEQGELFFPENWCLLTPDKVLPFRLPKICDSIGQDFYNKFIEREKIAVLVIDNLSMLSAIDENKSEDWKPVQDWLLYLRSKGLSIIIVHHAGKNKEGYRGTSRMLDCVDTAISLQDLFEENIESDDVKIKKIKVKYSKSRSFGGEDALPFEIYILKNKWSFRAIERTNIDLVVERLKLGMTQKDISIELKFSRPYISKLTKKAKKDGLLNSLIDS